MPGPVLGTLAACSVVWRSILDGVLVISVCAMKMLRLRQAAEKREAQELRRIQLARLRDRETR